MRLSPFLVAGAFTLALAAPALAQETPPAQPSSATSGTVTGPQAAHAGMMRLLYGLDGITEQQRQQLQTLIGQFRQSHPAGSPRDPAAMRTLRQQVMQILTPAQQSQLRSEIQQIRAQRAQQQPAPQPDATPTPPAP
ncbi:MAG TPA: hypothetical protein VIN40_02245 [Candidatus Tyrphobacter sp.]